MVLGRKIRNAVDLPKNSYYKKCILSLILLISISTNRSYTKIDIWVKYANIYIVLSQKHSSPLL